ncbi:hypothetical protein [Mesorhizobium sp. M0859]|uniref:hypothetical protein n=1 Tax=Mesorhizobium sp. M0859 TaxID=2957014 RepID=UPI0033376847
MILTNVVDAYLAKQRSLGMRFESAEVLLRRFSRVMGNRDIGEITSEAVALFLQGGGPLSAMRREDDMGQGQSRAGSLASVESAALLLEEMGHAVEDIKPPFKFEDFTKAAAGFANQGDNLTAAYSKGDSSKYAQRSWVVPEHCRTPALNGGA